MALPPLGPGPGLLDDQPAFDPNTPPEPDPVLRPRAGTGDVMSRERPEPDERRKQLVTSICDMVKKGKNTWDKVFRQMEKDQKFASGDQWPEDPKVTVYNDIVDDDLYVANITLNLIQRRVAATYAKNPRAQCKRRPRILSTVWDGTMESLAMAQQTIQAAQQAMMTTAMTIGGAMMGMPPGGPPGAAGGMPGAMPGQAPAPTPGPPGMPMPGDTTGGTPGAPGPEMMPGMNPQVQAPMMPPAEEITEAQAVIADAQAVKQQVTILNKIARTLEILYEYEISEQQQSFKTMMKMTVRRAATTGVGWTRIGFQRVMAKNPEYDSRIADIQAQLDTIERLSADLADGEVNEDSAAAEQLKLTMQSLEGEKEVVVREGLLLSWPKSTAIIPDPRCTNLREFLGCDWVAEEYVLTVNEIKETYQVDVSKSHTSYEKIDTGTEYERARATWQTNSSADNTARIDDGDADLCLVWHFYNKRDGLIYKVCDGYPDFLAEPAKPEFYTDRFWPWYLTAFNEVDGKVWPLSDVQLVRHMQRELNRSRQGLREHRIANRPMTVYAEGMLSEEDIEAFKNHPVNAMVGVAGLQPGQDINQVVQAMKGAPIDPNLYEVNPVFQDLQRTIGDQEADIGGTSGDTATETSIAAHAKASATGSAIDDIDETLSGVARGCGQILLLNVSEDVVKEIVGPGAMWPTLTKAEVARDLYLTIRAGSSGKPNEEMELQKFERLAPIMMALPGIKPTFMVKKAIERLDDDIDVDEAIADGLPSVTAMNAGKIPGLPGQQMVPSQQGPEGNANAPAPPQPSSQTPGPQPAAPAPTNGQPPTTRLQ